MNKTLIYSSKNETAIAIATTVLNVKHSDYEYNEEHVMRFEAVERGDGYYDIFVLAEVSGFEVDRLKAEIEIISFTYNTMRGIHAIDAGGKNV